MLDKGEDGSGKTKGKPSSINPLQVISSIFAAGLGVQSSKNRERDFKQGSFKVFVITGVIFTMLFIGALFAVVKVVLDNS